MVGGAGLEPATSPMSTECSNQLSYPPKICFNAISCLILFRLALRHVLFYHMYMRIQKIKGSSLVLVLIVLFISAIMLFFTMSVLVFQSKQVKTEQEKNSADLFAKSALDLLTNEVIQDTNAFLSNTEQSRTLRDMNICDEDQTSVEKKCKDDSKVDIYKLKYILAYRLKHDESLQVTLAQKDQAPTVSAIDVIFTNQDADNHTDRYVITAYYYTNPGHSNSELKTTGSCVVSFEDTVTGSTCLGGITITTGLNIPSDRASYGDNRFRLTFNNASTRPHFVRIKGLYSATDKVTWVSVTGVDYSDLPLIQEVVFKADVYGFDQTNEIVHSKLVKTVFVNASMPEVLDWVFYNGSNQSVAK